MKEFRGFYVNGEGHKVWCVDCKKKVIAYFEDGRLEWVCPSCGVRRAEVELLKKISAVIEDELKKKIRVSS